MMQVALMSLSIFLLSNLFYIPAFAHPLNTTTLTQPQPTPSTPPSCSFPGNPDIYGPGIRIGIYAQMLAVWFGNYFFISQLTILRDTVSIFSVAILIVCIIFALNPSSIYAIEVFLLLQILAWSCIMGVRAKSSYTSARFVSSVGRKVVNEGIYLACLALHVWFWSVGVYKMERSSAGEVCGTWIMYVVKVDLYGWVRKIMLGFSVFVLACALYLCMIEGLKPWVWWKTEKVRREFVEALGVWEDMQAEMQEEMVTGNGTSQNRIESTSGKEVAHKIVFDDEGSACTPPLKKRFDVRRMQDEMRTKMVKGNEMEEIELDGNNGEEVAHQIVRDNECSTCTPSPLKLELDREATLVQPARKSIPLAEDRILPQPAFKCCIPSKSLTSTRALLPPTTPAELSILVQIYESEKYIENCLSATPYQTFSNRNPLTPLTFFRYICSKQKQPVSQEEESLTRPKITYLTCNFLILKAIFTLDIPSQALVIYSHLIQSSLADPLNGPLAFYAALSYTKPKSLPPWPTTSLASSLVLSSSTTPRKMWLAWYYTLIDLAVHVLVITQVELTLRWNNVTGLNNLWGSVGQLIPFIIGVGGLGLVGGRWVLGKWAERKKKGGRRDEELEDWIDNYDGIDEILGIGKKVRDGWKRWKQEHEKVLEDGGRVLE
jgi:hypothetical protein